MPELIEHLIGCPYCGERIVIFIDGSVSTQSYVEDCQVCCRPISLDVEIVAEGEAVVLARDENQ